jgi:hypothetical protein
MKCIGLTAEELAALADSPLTRCTKYAEAYDQRM